MKPALKVLLVIGGVMLLAVVAVHLWLDAAITHAVERVGSQLTQSRVRLDRVSTSFLLGRATITGLDVGNPQGFRAPSALKIRQAHVDVDWKTILSKELIIPEILIDAPELNYEGLVGRNNLESLVKNVQKNVAAMSPAGSSPMQKTSASRSKTVVVKSFRLTNGRAVVWLVGDRKVTVKLPQIHLTDIGKKPGGTTAQEVTAVITSAVFGSVTKTVAGLDQTIVSGMRSIGDSAGTAVDKTMEGLRKLLPQVRKDRAR